MRVLWMILILVLAGCNEAQQQGRGELPEDWQAVFGSSNVSRLNYLQTQAVNNHQMIIFGVNLRDPNGSVVHKRGLIERITVLEGQVERLEKITGGTIYIDPNGLSFSMADPNQ